MANNIYSSYIDISQSPDHRRYKANQQRVEQVQKNKKYFSKAQEQYNDILKDIGSFLHIDLLKNQDIIDNFIDNPSLLMVQLKEAGLNEKEAQKLSLKFNQSYNTFFQVFAYCIEDAEKVGEYIGKTELNYGINLLKQEQSELHVLNKAQTRNFIRNTSVFGIQVEKNGTFTFGMRNNINTDIIEQGIIAATGQSTGGKNLAIQLLGEDAINLQQKVFDILSHMRIQTKTGAYYSRVQGKYLNYLKGQVEKYNSNLKDKDGNRLGFSEDTAKTKLLQRQRAMERDVSLSRKLEGSYRFIIDGVVKAGMNENEIISAIKMATKEGWQYSDSVPGVVQGDISKKDLSILQNVNQNSTNLLPSRDLSLKFGQNQQYNPDLYNSVSIFNTYQLILLEAEQAQEEKQLNEAIQTGQFYEYPEVSEQIEDVVGSFLGDTAQEFFSDE